MLYTDEKYAKATIRKRPTDSHKGDYGKVLVFAGSLGMAGAAVLCGRAALKTGAGLVTFLLPKLSSDICPILQAAVPEATCIEYNTLIDLNEYDAIVCGCGIGKREISRSLLSSLILGYGSEPQETGKSGSRTLVLDADALNLISSDPKLEDAVVSSSCSVIMTPHPGEAKRLLNTCEGISGLEARKAAVLEISEKYNGICVLKGSGTLISKGDDVIYENTTGNPGMATGGSGDVLAGMIASLAGQGYSPIDAARLGVYLHGKAGDIAANLVGEMSVTAGDIIDHIPDAIKPLYEDAVNIS